MPSSPVPRDVFDPLVHGLYTQLPYSHNDILSKSTSAALKTDEASIGRYEDVARRYLSGHAPLLFTGTLRGPFDRASGFVKPWAAAIDIPQPTTQQPTSPSLLKNQSPALCEPASSPRPGETQTTESSYLPSPESLNLGPHPFLERDEVARVEKWRDLVQSDAPSMDDFWASKSRSSTKRAREDSSWLKRRADKRPRTLEPELKLSSPVSIPDNNLRQQGPSSPLSSLTSLSGQPMPQQASSQAGAETKALSSTSPVARVSQKALPSSSQRLSQRTSEGSRPPRLESSRIEKRSGSPNTAANKAPPKRTSPALRSSPVVEPQSSPISSNDSTTESESSESSDEEVLETKQDVMEATDGPTVFVESDEVMEGQDVMQLSQPGEDRVLQMIDTNAIPRNGEAETKCTAADQKEMIPSTIKVALRSPSRKPLHSNLEGQRSLTAEKETKLSVMDSSVAISPNPGLRNVEDDLDRRSQNRTASGHFHEEAEPTPAPAPAAADRSTSTSVTSAPSTADFASTTLVEHGGDIFMESVQPSPEHQPSKPGVHDTTSSSQSPGMDNEAGQDENRPQQTEAPSTPRMSRQTQDVLPDYKADQLGTVSERIAVLEQSPWMKDASRELINDAPEKSQAHGTTQDEQSQSLVIPPEGQSPWMQRPTSQPQAANDAFLSPNSSPRLSPPSQETQEQAQPPENADRSNVLSDLSNTDFSIKSFSSFMSPSKPRPRPSNTHLPHTPSLLAAATENPWHSSKPKKRVSWAPLPHEVDCELDSPAPTSSFSRASPPPANPIPDGVEEGNEVFKGHFATVKRRTDPVKQRLLPSASQQSQRSPETEAMARAFVAAGSPRSSPMKTEDAEEKQKKVGQTAVGSGEETGDPVDEVDDVLANLGDFLTTWDVETDLERARSEDRAATTRKGILDVEIGGW